jgi:hypothetical protein
VELERIETHHNTDEQVTDYVERAQAICDQLGIVREREVQLFIKVLDMVSAKQLTVIQQPTAALLGGGMIAPPRH